MKITKFFMKRPTLFWSLMAGIVIAGIISYIQMPKLEDPAVAVKQAVVVVPYPGASAHEVELKVALAMEDAIRTLPDVRKVKTECQNGMAMINVEFQMTVLKKDLEQHFDLLRRKVNDVRSSLPQECYAPIVMDDMMDVYGIFYSFTADGYSYPEMYKYAKKIRRELLSVKGVKRITIYGNRSESIDITLPKEKISRNGIIPTMIPMALQSRLKPVNCGDYEMGDDRIPLRVSDEATDEKDIGNMLINTLDGKQIRLGDVATVKRGYAEPQTNGFFVDGKPALAICISMQDNAIVPDVGKAVDAKLADVMTELPAGMQTDKIFFQPDKVNEAVSSFMLNLLESVIIVIVVLIFSMGKRSGLIIGFGLILTVALSFPILLMLGTTLQRISLGAFIVAMGMLVDNAIVIMDGIIIDKQRGYGPMTYLFSIGRKTAMPLLGATLIAASTFMACYLSPDSAGEYSGDLFLVLCVSLLASWVLALVQVPICAKAWLPVREAKKASGEIMNSPVHRFIRRTISLLIGYKKTTIAVAVLLLVISILGMGKVKNLFFPDFDYKQFIVEYTLPSQTNPDRVRHDLLEMTSLLKRDHRIERVAASMGGTPARYCLVRPINSGGSCYGELMVDCKDYPTVCEVIPGVRSMLREKYPDAYIRVRKYNFSISSSHTVEVEFSGPDPAVLRRLSAQAEDIMRKCKYADPYTVENNWKPMGKDLVAQYVQEDALRSGVSRSDIGNALLAATDGMPVGVLYDQDRQVMVNLKVRNADGTKLKNIGDMPVWSTMNVHLSNDDLKKVMGGGQSMTDLQNKMLSATPLSGVTRGVTPAWDEDYIYRINGQRAIEAECDANTELYMGTPQSVLQDITPKVEKIKLPDGYHRRWVGENETSGEAIGNLMKYLPIIVFIILCILLALFNSWRKLGMILFCIPFVFCGITPALLLFRQPFTFMAILGMMGLIGMMTKNAIVLVDEITRQYKEEGKTAYEAVIDATTSRVRPVIMASLTTIVGMIPLISDPMYGSLALTIMGGLTVGTIITLILLPVFYATLYRVNKTYSKPVKTDE